MLLLAQMLWLSEAIASFHLLFTLPILAYFFLPSNLKSTYRHEFLSTSLMITLTFSPGKWTSSSSTAGAWALHVCGVVAADYMSGGAHVNPMVTTVMYTLGKESFEGAVAKVLSQVRERGEEEKNRSNRTIEEESEQE